MLGRVSFVVVVASISACSGASWTPPAQAGPHTVAHDTVQLSSPRGAADVVYPVSNSSDDKFGFVSFCHGGIAGLGLTFVNYQADMEIIASYGFVVVATQVNENGDCMYTSLLRYPETLAGSAFVFGAAAGSYQDMQGRSLNPQILVAGRFYTGRCRWAFDGRDSHTPIMRIYRGWPAQYQSWLVPASMLRRRRLQN